MNDVEHLGPESLNLNTTLDTAKNMRGMMAVAMDMCCSLSCMGC